MISSSNGTHTSPPSHITGAVQPLQHVHHIFIFRLGKYEDIKQEDVQHVMKNGTDQGLEDSADISQSKRHQQVLIVAAQC